MIRGGHGRSWIFTATCEDPGDYSVPSRLRIAENVPLSISRITRGRVHTLDKRLRILALVWMSMCGLPAPHISTDRSVTYDYDIVYVRARRAGACA